MIFLLHLDFAKFQRLTKQERLGLVEVARNGPKMMRVRLSVPTLGFTSAQRSFARHIATKRSSTTLQAASWTLCKLRQ